MALNKIVKENELKNTPYHSYKYAGTFEGVRLYEETFDQVKYDRDQKHYKERQVIIDNKTTIDKKLIDLKPEPVVTYSVQPNYETNRLIVKASDGNVTNIQWTHNLLKWQINDNVLVFREMNRETNEMYDRFYNLKTNTAVQSRKVLLENRDRNPDPDPETTEEGGSGAADAQIPGPYFAYLGGANTTDYGLKFSNLGFQCHAYPDDSSTNFARKTGQYPLGSFYSKKYFNQTYNQTWGEAIPNPADWSSIELYNEYKDIGYPLSMVNESYSAHEHYWEFSFEPDTNHESNFLFFNYVNYIPSLSAYGKHSMIVNPRQRSVQFTAASANPDIPRGILAYFLYERFRNTTYLRLSALYDESSNNKYTFRSVIKPEGSEGNIVSLFMNGSELTNHYISGGPNSLVYDHHKIVYGYTHTNAISTNDPAVGASNLRTDGKKSFDWITGINSLEFPFTNPFGDAPFKIPYAENQLDFFGKVYDMKIGTNIKGDLYHFPLTQFTDDAPLTGFYTENIGTNSYDDRIRHVKYGLTTNPQISDYQYDETNLSAGITTFFENANVEYRNRGVGNPPILEKRRLFDNPMWSKRQPKGYKMIVDSPFDDSIVRDALDNKTADWSSLGLLSLSSTMHGLSAGTPLVRTVNGSYALSLSASTENKNVSALNFDPINSTTNYLSRKVGSPPTHESNQGYPYWDDLHVSQYHVKRNPDMWFNYQPITCVSTLANVQAFRTRFVLLSPRHVMTVKHIRDDFPNSRWNGGDVKIPFMNMNNEFQIVGTTSYCDLSSSELTNGAYSSIEGGTGSFTFDGTNYTIGLEDTSTQLNDYSIFHLDEEITLSGIDTVKFLPRDLLPEIKLNVDGKYTATFDKGIDATPNSGNKFISTFNEGIKYDFDFWGLMVGKTHKVYINQCNFSTNQLQYRVNTGAKFPQWKQDNFKWSSAYFDEYWDRIGDSSSPIFAIHGKELVFLGLAQQTPDDEFNYVKKFGVDNDLLSSEFISSTYPDIEYLNGNTEANSHNLRRVTTFMNDDNNAMEPDDYTFENANQINSNTNMRTRTFTKEMFDDIQAAMNALSDNAGTPRYQLQTANVTIPDVTPQGKVTEL